MKKIVWDGQLPIRRYAIFNDILRGDYVTVVKDGDIERAEKWGGFVSWLGGVKPAETRDLHNPGVSIKRPAIRSA